jgi:3-methyl-2-oxobutanoate hydroxymethyltransferase
VTPAPPVTIKTIRKMAREGRPFSCLTCYDATTARWLARAGVHVLLVGDTAAEVILGFQRTIDMPLEVALAMTAAVKRGAPHTMVMADMPFMSYQASPDDAVKNAGRFLTEGLADVVKVEADETHAPLIERMARAGIPICGHVGSRPQLSALSGGYSPAGRTPREADQVVADAVALERAGSVMLLIEAVPEEVTTRVLEATTVPLIGIGAGPACHGQVLVLQDLLGMTETPPRFAEPLAHLGQQIQAAATEWTRRVSQRQIGGQKYEMKPKTPQGIRTPPGSEATGKDASHGATSSPM